MIRRRRLGVRARLTLFYSLGALLLASTVAGSSFWLTQRQLLSETEQTARLQFYRNVRDLRRSLAALPEIPSDSDIIQVPEVEEPPPTTTTRPTTTTTRPTTTEATTSDPGASDPGTETDPEAPGVDEELAAGAGDEGADQPADVGPDPNGGGSLLDDSMFPILVNPSPDTETDDPLLGPTTTVPFFPGAIDLDLFGSSLFGTTVEEANPNGSTPAEEPAPTPAPQGPINAILDGLIKTNTRPLLIIPPGNGVNDRRQFSPAGLSYEALPADLIALVGEGRPAQRRFADTNGAPRLGLGITIPEHNAQYYEMVSLTGLQDTLNSLRNILFGVAVAAGALGAALGYYSARRAIQPLIRVSDAAHAIAEGNFATRLDDQIDPDLRRLTTSFNHMVEALETRIRRDEQFASDVSHELRSPLMTLTASVGVLEGRRADLPPPAQQAVDLLAKDLRRFQRLVEDLLEISRMDVGAVVLDPTPIFLAEFLQFAVAQSPTPQIEVQWAARDRDLLVLGDKRRLGQVIANLLENAAKYAGGATAVSFERNGTNARIFVDDAGPGVRPEDRTRIFDRFTRASGDAGRRDVAKGVGLGLSLVHEHVRLHGGRVWITDRPDGQCGARFVVELPLDETILGDEEMAT